MLPGKAVLILLVSVLLASMAPAAYAEMERGELTIHTQQGPLTYFIEIARSGAERAQGLMYREELPRDHGMLFDFGQEQPVAFWMKNTPLPLDMLFIDEDGKVIGLHERAVPFSTDTVRSPGPVRYVLEIIGGSATERGIRAGDRVVPPPLH